MPLFGKKKEDETKAEKACPFTFPLMIGGKRVDNKFNKCIKEACQVWDPERNDCGLKQTK